MALPTYIIHVGPMKTGSTYLQRCIGGARAALLEQGVYYPNELADPPGALVHTKALTGARDPARLEEMRAVFGRLNAGGHDKILISYEFLTNLDLAGVERLRDMIGAPDVRIVYACRRWSDRIPSMHFQRIFGGSTQNLAEFFVRMLFRRRPDQDVDYATVWDRWAQVFGRDNLLLFPFSNLVDMKKDVFEMFCADVLGIRKLASPAQGRAAWATPSAPEVELIRAFNALHAVREEEEGVDSGMFWGWQALQKRVDLAPLLARIKAHETVLELNDRAASFDPIYERIQAYADRLTSTRKRGLIFTRRIRQAAYISQDYLLQPDVAAEIRGHYATIMQSGWAKRAA